MEDNKPSNAQGINDWQDVTDWQDVPVEQSPKVSELESGLRGLAQGATFGFADEIAGGIESLLTDKTYEQARDESRANFQRAEAENPGFYTAGELGGGVLSTVLPGGIAAKGAMAAGKGALAVAGRAAAMGAAEGGAQALGKAKELDSEAASDVALGAGIGGVAGGALGGAATKLGDIVSSGLKSSRLGGARRLAEEAPEIALGDIGKLNTDAAKSELELLSNKYTSGPMKEILEGLKEGKADVGKKIAELRRKPGKLSKEEIEQVRLLSEQLPTGKVTGQEALSRMLPEM
jgi:hypothetical protein